MSLTNVLSSAQYTKLRSPSYAGDGYVTLFSDRVVFKALLTSDLTAAGSWAVISYGSVTVGAYTDVFDGMEVMISATSNIKDSTYIGRIRAEVDAPTPTTLPVAESSLNFSPGATIWVLYNHVPQYRLSRPSTNDPATAVELVDYNITFRQLAPQTVGIKTAYIGRVNASGKLRVAIDAAASYTGTSGATLSTYVWTIDGTYIAGSSSTSRIIVDVDAGEHWCSLLLTDSGGRTSLRWFAIRAHADNDPPNVYGSNLSITGNTEQGWTASVPFFAGVDDVLPNAFAIFWRDYEDYGGVEGNLWGGGSATITNKQRASNIVTLTAANTYQTGQQVIVISDDAAFNGTFTITDATSTAFSYAQTGGNVGSSGASGTAHVNANNVQFVGWWQQEDDPATWDADAAVLESANFQFTGVGARMARMTSQLLGFSLNATPTLWGEIVSMTPWRAMLHFLQRYTTIANLCDITFDSTDNTYLFPSLSAQGGNAMESVRGIARQIRANPEFSPSGAIQIVTEVGQLDSLSRLALPTVASWDMQDIIAPGGITRSIEPLQTIGKVDADGGGYNTTSSQVIVYTARAPGTAQGEGSGSSTLSAQIMPASSDNIDTLLQLRQFVGNQLLIENNQEYLDVDHPDGYVGLPFVPSKAQLYLWSLNSDMVGENNVNRIVYTTAVQWTIESVTINYTAQGQLWTVKVRYHRVTAIGALGDDTTSVIPAPGEIPPLPDPGLPGFPFDPLDPLFPDEPNPNAQPPLPDGKVATFKGQELIVTSPTQAWWLQNFVTLPTPTALNITPPDLGAFELVQPAISPFYTDTAVPAYLLANIETDSAVWYAPNAATLGVAWTVGADFTGVYSVIRATGTASNVMVYTTNGSANTYRDNLTTQLGDKSFLISASYPFGTYANANAGTYSSSGGRTGGGCIQGQATGVFADGAFRNEGDVVVDLGAEFTISALSYWYKADAGGYTAFGINVGFYSAAQAFIGFALASNPVSSTSWAQATWTGSQAGVQYISFNTNSVTGECISYVDDLSVTYSSGGGDAGVRLSTDDGATFSSEIAVGASPGNIGGFDVQRSGDNSFAAGLDAVYRATTLGGAYSSYYSITGGTAQCRCVIVPYFSWSGVKQTTSANPDIIVALSAADGSSRSLLWVEGGATAGTVHDITPVAGITFDNANCVTCAYQHHIAVFGLVSGVYRLYITTNRGSSWTNVSSLTSASFIRTRRNDTTAALSGSSRGQLYVMANAVMRYSSKWATNGTFTRNMPDATLMAFDSVF